MLYQLGKELPSSLEIASSPSKPLSCLDFNNDLSFNSASNLRETVEHMLEMHASAEKSTPYRLPREQKV